MTIIERLRQYKELEPHKIALIVDDTKYTYSDLYDAILSIDIDDSSHIVNLTESKESVKNKVLLIQSQSFLEQLVQWLGALYRCYIPMVCHNEMDIDYVEELGLVIASEGVPPLANFGVLTSGTTGRPKPVLWAGGTIVTTSFLRPTRWIELLERYEVDHVYALPTKLRLLVRQCKGKLFSINYIIAGSQVLDRHLMEQLQSICPNMEFILYYGATELNYITYCTGREWLEREGTVGRPFPSVQIEEDDGVIYVTTKYHIEGISDKYTVNDCGYIDAEGYLMFTGRQGDVVNKGGYKISIPSMEAYLQSIDGVSEVAIIDIIDDVKGEDFVAYMVLEDNVLVADVMEIIRHHRPSIEWPKSIYSIPMLPLTECSKVDKRKLKEWYNKG